MSSRSLLRVVLVVVGLILFSSRSLAEPVKLAGLTLDEQNWPVPQDKTEPVCKALEYAGYFMPYGPALGWSFQISQPLWVLSAGNDTLLTISRGNANLYLIVDWRIPADLNTNGNIVSQETVDHLASEARKVCRIVQREAINQGIGPVDVHIEMWDLIVGTEVDYGPYDPDWHGIPGYTSDCDQLTGRYLGKSIGLNPSAPVPGHCPSLYVSAEGISHVRLDINDKDDEQTVQP